MDALTIDIHKFKKEHWSEQETQNVTMVVDFVQHLMNNHDFGYVRKTFGTHHYTQHNRNIPDGMENLIAYVETFAKRYPEYTYDVKQIVADGDRVIFHSHATVRKQDRGNDKKGMNIIDIWRIPSTLWLRNTLW